MRNLGELLISALAGPLESVTKDQLTNILNKLAEKNPTRHKTVVSALYPIVDLELEALTSQTKTKVDDSLIRGIKGALEASAAAHDINLTNLDAD